MAHPHIAAADGQAAAGKLRQGDLRLLLTGNFRPCLNHVHLLVSLVAQIHCDRIDGVFHVNTHHTVLTAHTGTHELGRQVAVGMTHGQGSLSRAVHAVGWIGIHASVAGLLQMLQVSLRQFGTKILILGLVALFYVEH